MEQDKKEYEIKWSNFKKIFDKNPVLIFENSNSLLEKLQGYEFDKNNEQEEDEEDNTEEKYDNEEVNEIIDSQILDLKLNNLSLSQISHDFDWFEIGTKETEYTDNYILVNASTFNKFKLKAIDFYIEKYGYKKDRVKYVSIKNKLEDRIKLTKNLLDDPNVDLIINPCFENKVDFENKVFNFNLNNSIYDKKLKKVIDVTYRSVTLLEDNYKCLYTYLCLQKNKEKSIDLENYSVIIIEPYVKTFKNFKKGEIEFFESFSSTFQKNKPSIKVENEYNNAKDMQIVQKILIESGLIVLYDEAKQRFDLNSGKFNFLNSVKYNQMFLWKNQKTKEETKCDFNLISNTEELMSQTEWINNLSFNFPPIVPLFPNFEYIYKYLSKTIDEFYEKPLEREVFKYFAFSNGNIGKEKIALSDKKEYNWFSNEKLNYAFLNSQQEQDIKNNKKDYAQSYGGIMLPKYITKDANLKNSLLDFLIGEKFEKLSGKYYKITTITGKEYIDSKYDQFNQTQDYYNYNIANLIKKLHIKDAKIVWYDYEGFSELFPVIDHVNPFNQIVNQVSVIVTKKGQEEKCVNIVKDTKNIKLQDLCELIEEIYSNKADYFVVFNKTYENTRNKEIASYVEKAFQDLENKSTPSDIRQRSLEFVNWFNLRYKNIQEFINMVNHINNNTVDLADCFVTGVNLDKNEKFTFPDRNDINTYFAFKAQNGKLINKPRSLDFVKTNAATFKKTMISIKFLKYFFSIKKIEKYITQNNIQLKNMITPYTSLKEIQKGTDAMEKAIQRHLGSIGDNLWNNTFVPNLKIYCENDVRAMMMVYDFIMELLKSAHPEIANYEYNLTSEKQTYMLENSLITIKE